MYIQHNLPAVNAARQVEINSTNFQKTAKKLSSGYKINSAADGAAELEVSEQMRSQIRGLNQSVENAEDGANYIQVADGSMHEIHAMLQRMRELSVQSLNDTNTPADRAALAAEFDQLQCEIDRISGGTDYNTQPVFGEHDPSYYQIEGNRKWEPDQMHFVQAPNNTLDIHLPDTYTPNDYTITIAPDAYTTQELMDEIDNALAALKPSNPGFVFELTKDGYCNLNFEGGKNSPTKIDSVDGGLAYLIYDCYNSYSSSSLLGTTAFEGDWPLKITAGHNDELQFYIEKTDGTPPEFVQMKIPGGDYSRSELINLINQKLTKYPDVTAKEYGSQCIQISGGVSSNITGLKGNMFKYEDPTKEQVYTSIFYDNTRYGTSAGSPYILTGHAYYNAPAKQSVTIDSSNETLKIKMKGDPDYTEISLLPAGTSSKDYSMSNIAAELNKQFKLMGLDIEASAPTDYVPGGTYLYGYYQHLILKSTTTGEDVSFEFDTTDPVSKAAYETLFVNTHYDYNKYPSIVSGSDPTPPNITGRVYLNGAITIPAGANTLSLSINGTPINMTIPAQTYPSLDKLKDELNGLIPADQQDKFSFTTSGGYLRISGTDKATSLSFGNTQGAYDQLFVGTTEITNNFFVSDTGEEEYGQGGTRPTKQDMATVTIPYDIPSDQTVITPTNNQFSFTLNDQTRTVWLRPNTYSRAALVAELDAQLKLNKIPATATLTGNRLTLTTTLTGTNCKLSISASPNGSAWNAFVGSQKQKNPPVYPVTGSPGSPAFVQGANLNGKTITLDNTNCTLGLTIPGLPSNPYTVSVATGGPFSIDKVAELLQTAIDDQIGKGIINVTHTDGGIRLTDAKNGKNSFTVDNQSSFYKAVLTSRHTNTVSNNPSPTKGSHKFDDAFIIGREDILNKQIEIVAGSSDKFILDFKHPEHKDPINLEVTLDEGVKSSDEIAKELTHKLNEALRLRGLYDFNIDVTIGKPHHTGVTGSNDDKSLQITLTEATDPATGKKIPAPSGEYIIDGVRGNAAYSLFYKTTGKPEPSYTTGVQDISGGVSFPSGKNVLTMCVDSEEYSFTFDERDYTAEEFLKELNEKFRNGDDNGKKAPLEATLADGHLRLTHKDSRPHTITKISGSAKGIVFYREEDRDTQSAYMLQVGALGHQGLELPRLRVNTTALNINSLTITKPKYANKALWRLDEAITLLSTRRSLYGALYNRIDHITANNSNTSENLQASESRIRDTDFGSEMIQYACSKILQQSSQAMLAQANQLPNRVTSLFQ